MRDGRISGAGDTIHAGIESRSNGVASRPRPDPIAKGGILLIAENNTGIDDRQRRRRFLLFSGALGVVTLLIFMIVDYREGNISEIFLDGFMCAVIIIGTTVVFRYNLDRPAYCVGINLLSLTLLYDVSIGAGGAGGLFWLPVMPLVTFFFMEKIYGGEAWYAKMKNEKRS